MRRLGGRLESKRSLASRLLGLRDEVAGRRGHDHETTIFPETAGESVPSTALRVYVPALFSLRLVKVATPLTTATVVVLSDTNPPPAGLEEFTEIAIEEESPVTIFP